VSRRTTLGAGLVEIPPMPAVDPKDAVLDDPQVPERKRFCAQCAEPVGRSHGDVAGRTEGFCRKCAHPFSFKPKLVKGDLVAGQYEVVGCLAHGGLGWIYLARDLKVSFYVVLKGLLNSGDADAMAAALSERRFLAEVEHPNIVKIHNFVEHDDEGYIVMEYVGGKSFRVILEDRRTANGGVADPLPLDWALANMVDILPAIGHLHDQGLAFCDFKPDNVMQTQTALKLIDLGGVYRMGDADSPIYGTKGFQAPEVARTGPTIASDIYTVGRTLAVLCTDFKGHQSTYPHSLPAQADVALYAAHDSLYRILERATALNPDERFQSAEEMHAQLLGVLREVRAAATGSPRPGSSTLFTPEGHGMTTKPDWRALPTPLVDSDDPASGFIASIGAVEPEELIETLRAAGDRSAEIDLWLARTLLEVERVDEALPVLETVERTSPWEWRTSWYRGLAALVAGDAAAAAEPMRLVYRLSPGELAPKLALALCGELVGDVTDAARWYEIVLRTDPSFTSAAFGLARCRLELGDRVGAVAACEQVPATSSVFVDAQVAAAEILLGGPDHPPELPDVLRAGTIVERLTLDKEQRSRLSAEVLEASLVLVQHGGLNGASASSVMGEPMTDEGIRLGLETTYRRLARLAGTTSERIALVDRANRVRPRTLL
jgi:serine/threonine-protein kinase PknG